MPAFSLVEPGDDLGPVSGQARRRRPSVRWAFATQQRKTVLAYARGSARNRAVDEDGVVPPAAMPKMMSCSSTFFSSTAAAPVAAARGLPVTGTRPPHHPR